MGREDDYTIEPRADLTDANLRGANLHEANLTGADLSGAILRGADRNDVILHGANPREAERERREAVGRGPDRRDPEGHQEARREADRRNYAERLSPQVDSERQAGRQCARPAIPRRNQLGANPHRC